MPSPKTQAPPRGLRPRSRPRPLARCRRGQHRKDPPDTRARITGVIEDTSAPVIVLDLKGDMGLFHVRTSPQKKQAGPSNALPLRPTAPPLFNPFLHSTPPPPPDTQHDD